MVKLFPLSLKHGRYVSNLLCVLMMILSLFLMVYLYHNAMSCSRDFSIRWYTTKVLIHGENPYEMRFDREYSKYAAKILKDNNIQDESSYLPSSLFILIPYAFLDLNKAIQLWFVVNVIATIFLFKMIFHAFPSKVPSLLLSCFIIFLFLFGRPFRALIFLGQFDIVALAFFMVTVILFQEKRYILAGLFLSCAMIKYNMIIPLALVCFASRDGWKPLLVCLFVQLVLTFFVCYHLKILPLDLVNDVYYATLRNAHIGRNYLWNVLRGFAYIKYILVLSLAAVLFILRLRRGYSNNDLGLLSLACMFSIIVTANNWYDAVCLIFPLIWIVGQNVWKLVHKIILCFIGIVFFGQTLLHDYILLDHSNRFVLTSFAAFLSYVILFILTAAILFRERPALNRMA